MPHEPKKRHSRARQGKRRHAIKFVPVQSVSCANCGISIVPHSICSSCGHYKGQSYK